MIAVAAPAANGSRENYVWFRYQQTACSTQHAQQLPGAPSSVTSPPPPPTDHTAASCRVVGEPLYYDTYWWSNSVDGKTNSTGPATAASAAGFYRTLLESKRWWAAELNAEGVMQLSLPSPAASCQLT